MKLISHRGNTNGINSDEENNPSKIAQVSSKFKVEVDLWSINNELHLGHDSPDHKIDLDFLERYDLLVHCKNLPAIELLSRSKKIEFFYQEDEKIIITSKNNYLYHASSSLKKNNINNSIHVYLGGDANLQYLDSSNYLVTDYPLGYQ
tara:strand:+ start:322 stop:765 length:444 start_codon:yes stop_codon:yes gene_type:complete